MDAMPSRRTTLLLTSLVGAALAFGSCRFDYEDADELMDGLGGSNPSLGGSPNPIGDGDGDLDVDLNLGGMAMGGQPTTDEGTVIETLPEGFTPGMADPTAENPMTARGGYKLVGPLAEIDQFEQDECANILRGITRDFDGVEEGSDDGHPDFGIERADGPGFTEPELNDDRKPIHTTNPEIVTEINALHEWYTDIDGVNRSYVVDIWLEPVGDSFVFDSGLYFPVDGEGTDTTYPGKDEKPHNFHFTTEIHTSFLYEGGEFFTFRGDDDVWVFINNKIAVDLGGIHGPIVGSIDLDEKAAELGLELGATYNLDLFHAERRQFGSNFRIETTLNFTGCGEILPVDVVK